MLTDKLKENTKANHQQTEVALVGRIRNINTEKDYASLLGIFYSYFGGLEQSINAHIDISQLPDHEQRRKTSALADDLKQLNAKAPAMAAGKALPVIDNHLQAMGALYVIEGSILGGKIISKMIAQKLALPNGEALSFFNGYGGDTEKMWTSFKEILNAQPKNPEEEDAIIQAANDTFLHFKNWIKKHS